MHSFIFEIGVGGSETPAAKEKRSTNLMSKRYFETSLCITLLLAASAGAFAGSSPNKNGEACPVPAVADKAAADAPIAIVEGKSIFKTDLSGPAAAEMLKVRQQEYQIESQALEDLIRQKVVEIEARKEGLTVEQLYAKEVDSKVPDPSDAEAKGYYLAVKTKTTLPFSDIEPQIKRLMKNAEIQEAREKYADSLRAKSNVVVYLQPPTVELGSNDPARIEGAADAPVTIVEFGDFQCPFCSRVEPTLTNLLKKYKGEVKLAFRDFPLSSIHPHAEAGAEASRCAEEQGKFWAMHDAMYADQSKLADANLIQTATHLGMNQDSFAACLKSGKYKAAIQQDVEAGTRAGVTGTPTFFINGQYLQGSVPQAQFEKIIDAALAAHDASSARVASR